MGSEYRHRFDVKPGLIAEGRREYLKRTRVPRWTGLGSLAFAWIAASRVDADLFPWLGGLNAVLLALAAVSGLKVRQRGEAVVKRYAGVVLDLVVGDKGLRFASPFEGSFQAWSLVDGAGPGEGTWVVFWHDRSDASLLPAAAFAGAAGMLARERAKEAGARVVDD